MRLLVESLSVYRVILSFVDIVSVLRFLGLS